MAPSRRAPRNSSGQLAPAEGVFADYKGNIQAKAGQSSQNAIGAAENALVSAEVVKNLLDKGVTPDLRQKADSILTTMGGTTGLTTSLEMIIGDQSPELASSSIDSVLRSVRGGRSGSRSVSARAATRYDDTPIPPNLTAGSPSARRRSATQVVDLESDEDLAQFEEPAGQTPDGIPTTPRPLPAGPFLVSDSIPSGNGRKDIHSLVVADETMVSLDKTVAEVFGALIFTQLGSAIRAAYSSGGSARTNPRFSDKPIPIDLTGSSSSMKRQARDPESDEELLGALNAPTTTPSQALPVLPREWPAAPYIIKDSIAFGNGRRVVYSLLSADEAMIFLSDDAAQMFGHLLLILRKRISPSLPLSAAARMAGIGKSLVLSVDLPLLIPYPDSTAMASYVTSISNMSIFGNMNDARVLARDTTNFMKSQGWEDSAGLAIQYERVLTPPEGFLPVRVVADKLTHLGQPLKPAVIFEGRKWPQVIAADALRQLGWDAFDQIGQAPDNDEHAA
ncbi:hypothetical protein FCIRC_2310 [Fusarium circinatum]|uniref:Uncharacterized protein n=1 Tax=Fusarium circinatum TaxID=48490 RepID=A0A8H5XAQ5_FUSCI|nr:hypothetical protein FCIRC_2310 [Fusarium circinatum]